MSKNRRKTTTSTTVGNRPLSCPTGAVSGGGATHRMTLKPRIHFEVERVALEESGKPTLHPAKVPNRHDDKQHKENR